MGYLALDRYRNIEAELSAFCDRWNVSELALLDLPEEERTDPDAELDVLVTISRTPNGRCSTGSTCRMSFRKSLAARRISTAGPDW